MNLNAVSERKRQDDKNLARSDIHAHTDADSKNNVTSVRICTGKYQPKYQP